MRHRGIFKKTLPRRMVGGSLASCVRPGGTKEDRMFESLGIINIWVFVAGVVFIILMPGPNSLYVLATGMRRGVRDAYKAAGGVFAGDCVLMLAASLGVDSVMRLYPLAFMAIQCAGAGYLVFLGLSVLHAQWKKRGEQSGAAPQPRLENPFKRALALSLSNPKAILFFISFFVQFVDPRRGHPGLAFLVLAGIVQIVSLTYLSALIFGGSRLAAMFRGRTGLVVVCNVIMGLVFVGFGCNLALRVAV